MNYSDFDDIQNGPRHHEAIETGSIGDTTTSGADSAFARGRELYKKGGGLPSGSSIFAAAVRRGYRWQKSRDAKKEPDDKTRKD